ncbi:MAG TPA: glycosyltransferase family 4 protein [Mycobacterium sp.]|nr:glycosyltransferase family 4 protein [Mycobacterium sp.]
MSDGPLKILFIVDFRSEISRGWIRHIASLGHSVHVVSSFPVEAGDESFPVTEVHLGLSQFVRMRAQDEKGIRPAGLATMVGRVASSDAVRRIWHAANSSFGGLEARRHLHKLRAVVEAFRPDLIHAMRIPYEGVLAARLGGPTPLLLSTWGNDLTLWAARRRRMAAITRFTLNRADALHADCRRDIALAEGYGFSSSRPTAVLPGGGGVDRHLFHAGEPDPAVLAELGLGTGSATVINPRGVREYVRNDCFLHAWPRVLRSRPDAVAVCVGMRGNPELERLRVELGVAGSVHLLPALPPPVLAEVFRSAVVSVSPSVHDGTPNTLLEAMATGCLPVAGRLDSISEWIDDGVNGVFCDATDPTSIADAILMGLEDSQMQHSASKMNDLIISERAERKKVMDDAVVFYRSIVEGKNRRP